MFLLHLIAESGWKAIGGRAFPHPKPDLASSSVCGHRWTIAGYSDPEHHSSHVIAVVFHCEFVCQGIGDGHLGRHVGNKVAVKKPMTGRWSPICGHRSVGEQPKGCNGELLSGRENVIGLTITRTVHAEVGAVHVHRVPAVAGIDPAPTYRFACCVGQTLGVGP